MSSDDSESEERTGEALSKLRRYPAGRYVEFTPAGQGGMGVVYWARDTELNREVALKVLQPEAGAGRSMITPASPDGLAAPLADGEHDKQSYELLRRRFLMEAWITAGLSHPSIVPVYELGENPHGVPYYTMRFVRGGRTFTDAMTVREPHRRLELIEPFLRVVDAVRYAHSQGVIHRDIKPSNVALGEFGEVVLLDWGLARAKDRPDLGREVWREHIESYKEAHDLQTLTALGTPGYMSPEATTGDASLMDEQSDVFSLGVMLYEVLALERPIRFKSYGEYVQRVRNERPIPPIEVQFDTPQALSDLCMRALATQKSERLASVAELADGIRDWQRQDRAARKVEKHLTEAQTALELAREATGGARLTSLDRAAAACQAVLALRDEEERAHDLTREVHALRVEGLAEQERGNRRKLLARGAAAVLILATIATVVVAGVLAERERQAVRERERSEGLSRFMLLDLHDRLEKIGRTDLLEDVARETLAHFASLSPDEMNADRSAMRVVALENTGGVLLDQGLLEDANAVFSDALEIVVDPQVFSSEPVVAKRVRARLLTRIAAIDARRQSYDNAIAAYQRAVPWQREVYEASGREGRDARTLFHYLVTLGDLQMSRVLPQKARTSFDEAMALAQRFAGTEVDSEFWIPRLIRARHGLAAVARSEGRRADAERHLRLALVAAQSFAKENPHSDEGLVALANAHIALAIAHRSARRYASALASFKEAEAMCEHLVSGHRYNLERANQVVAARNGAAEMLEAHGDFRGAGKRYEKSLHVLQSVLFQDPDGPRWQQNLADVHRRLGRVSRALGDFETSVVHLEKAAELLTSLLASDGTNVLWREDLARTRVLEARTLLELPRRLLAHRRATEAVDLLQKLLLADAHNANLQARVATAEAVAGRAAFAVGRVDEAMSRIERAISGQRALVQTRPDAEARATLARYERLRRMIEVQALPAERLDPEDLVLRAEATLLAGRSSEAVGQFRDALELFVVEPPGFEAHLWMASRAAIKAAEHTEEGRAKVQSDALRWLEMLATRMNARLPALKDALRRTTSGDEQVAQRRRMNHIVNLTTRIRETDAALDGLRALSGFDQVRRALPVF